jgi:hypothetical protein
LREFGYKAANHPNPVWTASVFGPAEVPAEDWDFSAVTEPYLHFAVFYKYAREVEWVRARFESWHAEQPLEIPSNEWYKVASQRKS